MSISYDSIYKILKDKCFVLNFANFSVNNLYILH